MANTYFNDFFIPNSFRWKDGKLREDLAALTVAQTIILIVETFLLMLLMYYINNGFLANVIKSNNSSKIAIWTAGIYIVINLAFITFMVYNF